MAGTAHRRTCRRRQVASRSIVGSPPVPDAVPGRQPQPMSARRGMPHRASGASAGRPAGWPPRRAPRRRLRRDWPKSGRTAPLRQELRLHPTPQHGTRRLHPADRLARGTSESWSGGIGVAVRFYISRTAVGLSQRNWSRGVASPTVVGDWGHSWVDCSRRIHDSCRFGAVAIKLPGELGNNSAPGAMAREGQGAETERIGDDVSPAIPHRPEQLPRCLVGGSSLHGRDAPLN